MVWWIWDYFAGLMDSLGLRNKSGKLLFLGLDGVGKTTLMHMLKEGRLSQCQPTYHATTESMKLGGITFTVYDLGGHDQARRVWKRYTPAVDGIVFIVDATDYERIATSRAELEKLLSDDQVAHAPILILGNKIDKQDAMSEEQLKTALGVAPFCTGKGTIPRSNLTTRPMEVFMISIIQRFGYGTGFRWLSQYLD